MSIREGNSTKECRRLIIDVEDVGVEDPEADEIVGRNDIEGKR
jgi:hypothetical protein